MRFTVFISGPYSGINVEQNLDNVKEVASKLIDLGFAPIIPHFYHYIDMKYNKPYDIWLECALELLERADIMFRLPGNSSGADKEEELANTLNMTVYHSMEELEKDLKTGMFS